MIIHIHTKYEDDFTYLEKSFLQPQDLHIMRDLEPTIDDHPTSTKTKFNKGNMKYHDIYISAQ